MGARARIARRSVLLSVAAPDEFVHAHEAPSGRSRSGCVQTARAVAGAYAPGVHTAERQSLGHVAGIVLAGETVRATFAPAAA